MRTSEMWGIACLKLPGANVRTVGRHVAAFARTRGGKPAFRRTRLRNYSRLAPNVDCPQKECLLDSVQGVIATGATFDSGCAGVGFAAPIATTQAQSQFGRLAIEVLIRGQDVGFAHFLPPW